MVSRKPVFFKTFLLKSGLVNIFEVMPTMRKIFGEILLREKT
jgi:hypothetical protein